MMRRASVMVMAARALACGGRGKAPQPGAAETNPLLAPGSAAMRQAAPERYQARFETSAGVFVVDVTRAWAPGGADRLNNLVRHGFYDGALFFRVVPGFGCSSASAAIPPWRHAGARP